MAEDNQNSEMEDILSSIKNILEEDEQRQKNQNTIDVLDDVLADATDDVDDILELSPDMRIEEKAEVNAELQNDNAPEIDVFADIDLPNNNTTEPEFVIDEPVGTIDDIPEVVVNDEHLPLANDQDEVLQTNDDSFIDDITPIEDILAEDNNNQYVDNTIEDRPNTNFETTLPEELSFENLSDNKVDDIVVDKFEEIGQAPAIVDEPIMPEQIELVENAIVADAPAIIENAEVIDKPIAIKETPVVEKTETQKSDASSKLISSFAKMFSREEATVEEKVATTENIIAVGNAQKTLEEFVLEAITKVIGNEISYKWNKGEDFRTYAEAEINHQISAWVNENLPSMVENIIKQEIQRVIAKVGS